MSNRDDEYLLFYSNKCLHSKEFLTILTKDVQLNKKFTKVNIDNKNIKLPPYIKAVPSAIITINGNPQLLVGSSIFKWYNETHKQTIQQQEILDWDPTTMTGYSDGFSYLDNGNDAHKKSFAFLNERHEIYAPDEKSFGGSDDRKNGGIKTEMEMNLERMKNQRDLEVPNAPTRM